MILGLGHGLGFGGRVPAGPVLTQVATRASAPRSGAMATATQMMSVSWHQAKDDITALKIVLPNYYVSADVEVGPGGSPTAEASIEYPAATMTRIKFGGADAGALPSGGLLTSDLTAVTIPSGAWFGVRVYRSGFTGGTMPFMQHRNATLGDMAQYGTSGIVNKVMSGTVTNTATSHFVPCAILAETDVKSVLLLGDSRVYGQDDVQDSSGDVGELARSIGPSLPYINAGLSGDGAQTWLANHAARLQMANFVTHVACEFGVNDLIDGRTPAQVLADLKAIRALIPAKPFFQTTVTPATNSTNTVTAGYNGNRTALNDLIRAGVPEFTGYFETADAVENSRNGGLYASSTYTTDGLHMNQTGYLALKNSGAINPAVFV